MISRKADDTIALWAKSFPRKPLLIQGARQVGKTFLVNKLGASYFETVAEINFDQRPELRRLFSSRDVKKIADLIEIETGVPLIPGKTLLFLDEIQTAPEVLSLLRYFHEEIPKLHVVATGSLLDFSLTDHNSSMPVGRIEYLHLGPLTFDEYLQAVEPAGAKLLGVLKDWKPATTMEPVVHQKLDQHYLDFLIVGGLPEAVRTFAEFRNLPGVTKLQDMLVETYQDDFAKYRGRIDYHRLRKVFQRIPGIIGHKCKYSNIDPEENSREIKRCLELLGLARIITRVRHSAGNAPPLEAEVKDRDFKLLFIDVGLVSRMLGVTPANLLNEHASMTPRSGLLAEQFVGQHLLYSHAPHRLPQLHYWRRQAKSANAEVDYLLAPSTKVIPVEVKSGKTGTLRSLHQFVKEKHSRLALRFNREPPSLQEIEVDTQRFKLLSLPLSMIGETQRLLDTIG